jgi:hypothetical protein
VFNRPATGKILGIRWSQVELATIAKEYGIKPKGKRDDVAVAIMTKIQNTTYVKDTSKKI